MKNKSANLSEGTKKSSYEALFSIQSHHPNEIKKSAYLSKKTAQKIELLCAFLDNGPTIPRKKRENKSTNLSHPRQAEPKKSSYEALFLDSDQPSKWNNEKNKSANLSNPGRGERKNRVIRRFSRLGPTIQMKQTVEPRTRWTEKSSYEALFSWLGPFI